MPVLQTLERIDEVMYVVGQNADGSVGEIMEEMKVATQRDDVANGMRQRDLELTDRRPETTIHDAVEGCEEWINETMNGARREWVSRGAVEQNGDTFAHEIEDLLDIHVDELGCGAETERGLDVDAARWTRGAVVGSWRQRTCIGRVEASRPLVHSRGPESQTPRTDPGLRLQSEILSCDGENGERDRDRFG